jgi:glucose/arabinose dehydrogenase
MKIKHLIAGFSITLLSACQFQTPETIPEVRNPPSNNEAPASEPVIAEPIVEEFVSGLEIPWDMAFTSDERMLITERPGRLRVVNSGKLETEPLHTFPEVSSTGEEGLMSVELDPDYPKNKWIYLSMAYMNNGVMKVKVVRFTDSGNHLENETPIIDELPAARYHAGCRLAFGPDGKLYISVGDALERDQAQNLNTLNGKILRLNKDGSVPADNPFENSPIWSYGHRNPQGIDWNDENGEMYSTEHGPSTFDGPPGGDELNHIIKGGNYGWPLVSHDRTAEGTIPPMIQFTPAEPPGSVLVYSGKAFPQFKNNIFFGSLGGEGLLRLEINPNQPDKVLSHEKMPQVDFGRIRNVIEGPDGFIYFSTSNRDGRGSPASDDDHIFRIRPI